MAFQLSVDISPRGLPPLSETLPQAIENLIRQIQPEKIILFRRNRNSTETILSLSAGDSHEGNLLI